MVLRSFERRLERLVEGVFARAFKSGLRPVEIARRLVREVDDHRTVGVAGNTVGPNHFIVYLGPQDAANFADVSVALAAELADVVRDHASDEGYGFMGPVAVDIQTETARRPGTFRIEAKLREGAGGTGAGSLLLANGQRLVLGDFVATIGRLPECTIQLADTNVSRVHAEVRRYGDGFVAVDLGSTNGTKVNGARIREHLLRHGDEIVVGVTKIVFQAS